MKKVRAAPPLQYPILRLFLAILFLGVTFLGWFSWETKRLVRPDQAIEMSVLVDVAPQAWSNMVERANGWLSTVKEEGKGHSLTAYIPEVTEVATSEMAYAAMEAVSNEVQSIAEDEYLQDRWFYIQHERIRIQMNSASEHLKLKKWSEAYAQAVDLQGMLYQLREEGLVYAEAQLASVRSAQSLSKIDIPAPNPDAALSIKKAMAAHEEGNLDFFEGRFAESLGLHKMAQIHFMEAKDTSLYDSMLEAQVRLGDEVDKETLVLLQDFGGVDWTRLASLLKKAESGDDPTNERLEAYERVRNELPNVISKAMSAKERRGYDECLNRALAAAKSSRWNEALTGSLQAASLPCADVSQAVRLAGKLQKVASSPSLLSLQLEKGACLEFRWVAPGTFSMGSTSGDSDEGPVREVSLSRGFWLSTHELTRAQYYALSSDMSWPVKAPEYPKVNITWHAATAYCVRLGSLRGVQARLPTEAEWEYSCRAGTETEYGFGNAWEDLAGYGNACDQGCAFPYRRDGLEDGHAAVAPVGRYLPNKWGFFDVHGNVMEWCADGYDPASYVDSGNEDPFVVPGERPHRVVRGGCWKFGPDLCRSAARYRFLPAFGSDYIGFRVVLTALKAPSG